MYRFFGSTEAVFAGTRGYRHRKIKFASEVHKYPSIKIWLELTALAVFSDQKVGVLREGHTYVLVKPRCYWLRLERVKNSWLSKGIPCREFTGLAHSKPSSTATW